MITKREWRWVLAVGVVALALTSVPYLLGIALQSDRQLFGGFVYGVEDGYSYLAKMRQGAEGGWLFHIAYTSEPHPGTFFFPFHLLLGKLASLLPGPDLTARMVWTYHGARLILGMFLLLTTYRFLAAFTSDVRVRRLAFSLVTFGGGLGWLLILFGYENWLGSFPLDLILPEGFAFLVLFAFPHIALAQSLLLWGALFLLRTWGVGAEGWGAVCGSRFACAVLAGLSWLLMGLVVPFYVLVAWAVTGAVWLALALRRVIAHWGRIRLLLRSLPWQEAGLAALAGLFTLPVVIYSAWVFLSDPVYATWSAQNLILSPSPLHYLAAYGVLLVLAGFAAPRAWRDKGPGWVALAWVAVVPLLVYLPFNLQRRLVAGVQVPLSLLAAQGLFGLRLRGAWLRAAAGGLLIVLSLTNGLLVGESCVMLLGRPASVFRHVDEVAALDWLGGRAAPDDVILSAYETGNYLPARVMARSFIGHGPETVHLTAKRALVARFFDPAVSDGWRRDMLAEYGVDWIFWGPAERALGHFDPRTVLWLEPLYQGDGYTILRVTE